MKRNEKLKNMIWTRLATFCALAVLMTACASEEKLQGTAMAPAAQGKLTADKGSGGNTDLEVEVEHLAPPERVASGATDYVIWVQPQGSQTFQNIGVLEVNDDLEGKYQTNVPYESFRVVVTPEPNRVATRPSGPIVFDQSISR